MELKRWNQSRKSYSQQLKEEREYLFHGKRPPKTPAVLGPTKSNLSESTDAILAEFFDGVKLHDIAYHFKASFNRVRDFIIKQIGKAAYNNEIERRQSTHKNVMPSNIRKLPKGTPEFVASSLSTRRDLTNDDDLTYNTLTNSIESILDEETPMSVQGKVHNTKFSQFLEKSGEQVVKDFIAGEPISGLINKYKIGHHNAYKRYLIDKIGLDKFQKIMEERQTIQVDKKPKSKAKDLTFPIQEGLVVLNGINDPQTTLPRLTLPRPGTLANSITNKIPIERGPLSEQVLADEPTAELPKPTPEINPLILADCKDSKDKDVKKFTETLEITKDFMNSSLMLDLAFYYPTIWDVVRKYIIYEIGPGMYDELLISRLYAAENVKKGAITQS